MTAYFPQHRTGKQESSSADYAHPRTLFEPQLLAYGSCLDVTGQGGCPYALARLSYLHPHVSYELRHCSYVCRQSLLHAWACLLCMSPCLLGRKAPSQDHCLAKNVSPAGEQWCFLRKKDCFVVIQPSLQGKDARFPPIKQG